MSTIPASHIVNVVPNVLPAGGQALDIVAVMLTTSARVPIGAVQSFADADSVGAYFGLNSTEYSDAIVYFNGFDNSNIKPAKVYFAQYNQAAVAAFLRSAHLGLSLTQLQAITPAALTVTFNGTPHVSSSINLSGASSFSNVATLIQAAFTTPPFAVTYDSVLGALVFTGTATGSAETVTYASAGTMATALKLTSATGAIISQGADAAVPGPFMDGVKSVTQDWATFMTCFDPDGGSGNTVKESFAAWANGQADRFGYVVWDTDTSPSTQNPATNSLGYLIGPLGLDYTGYYLIGGDGLVTSNPVTSAHAAFVCGAAASIDFNETNGRITFAFKKQSGLPVTATTLQTQQNLEANGYNTYGAYATANDQFQFNYPGKVGGPFEWFDSFINQIWLNNQFQLALMVLLTTVKSIPYNADGYTQIKAACLDVINQGLNFGAFRRGVTLSQAQIAEVNADAGIKISDALSQNGWYLQVKDANPQVRQVRGSPPMTFWYMDGQSVQQINLTSVDVE